jgi:tetratricopeptide (TPR) repeat protein
MTLSRALINAGEAAKVRADVASTREWTERAIEIGLRIGNPAWVVFGFGNLADACRILGEWPEAHKALERASSFVAETAPLSASNIFLSTGRLALCEGEWEGAERAFEEALAIAEAANDRQLTEAAHSYLAELDILRGSPDVALRRLRPLQATDEASLGVMLPTLAWAELEAGDIGGAEETARRAVKRTRGAEPIYLIDALRIQGAVFNRQGRHSDAERVLQEGLAMARSVPFPYAEARMLEELGDRKGAHAIFRRLGARKDAERTAPVATERQ